MVAPGADPAQEKQRGFMRGVMQELWHHLVEHEDAPEGIELFEWRTLPYCWPGVEIMLAPELEGLATAPDELPNATADPRKVTIPPWRTGTVRLTTDRGDVDLSWWAGYDRYHRIAVISCGPREVE
jgi:hypothetical protein